MRVNVYAEEMTDRIELIFKTTEDGTFTGLRFYLELPATIRDGPHAGENVQGPFIHRPGDDDSAAVTFWGKRDLRRVLWRALALLNEHHEHRLGMNAQAAGTLEVGRSDKGEVVVNHPDLSPDENGVGHIVFSPEQARGLAAILIKQAAHCDAEVWVREN